MMAELSVVDLETGNHLGGQIDEFNQSIRRTSRTA